MRDNKMNRRSILRKVGAGACASAVGASISVSVAAAGDGDEDPITILEGGEKMRLAREFARTEQFGVLVRQARENGHDVRSTPHSIHAGRVETDGFEREVVSYEFDVSDDDVRAGIVIARDLTTDDVEYAHLDYHYEAGPGVLDRIERYEAATPVARTQTGESTRDRGVEFTTIEANTEAVSQLIDELEAHVGGDDEFSTQYFHDLPDLPDVLNISTCSGCYYASGLVCRTVCGAFGGFICGLLGITVVGAVGCVTFVKAVCYVAEKASGCGDDLAATICRHPTIDVCGPDSDGDIIDVDIPAL